ncbi:MAG: hypothetical protein DHS20C01_20590 [marine bacterium B5-7]|nr:MAG: hypothetical protein DHS20C01_20590 [marine bacterium B5-7]
MSKTTKVGQTSGGGTESSKTADEGTSHEGDQKKIGRGGLTELLPSDTNESTDISPRVAFLAYN